MIAGHHHHRHLSRAVHHDVSVGHSSPSAMHPESASLGFGLLISASIRIQFVAAQTSIVAGFLPAFFLSGLIFDLESTPRFVQIVSHVVPARYFVSISHTLFMAGDIWPVLLPNALALAFMAVLFISLAFRKITKRLES